MNRSLLVCAAVIALALSAGSALAAGINLSWSECGALGTANRNFACNTNVSAPLSLMIISYVPPPGGAPLVLMQAFIDLQSAGSTLPQWWSFKNTGSCRQTALTSSADFTANAGCTDYWQGMASGGFVSYTTPSPRPGATPNTARIRIVLAIPVQDALPQNGSVEYYGARLTLSNLRTVGTGSCAGCLDPVCLVLNEVDLSPDTIGPGVRLTTPLQRNWITWQGGLVAGGCPAATPVRNGTWGALKSLYR